MPHLAIDDEILATDCKLGRKKAWQTTLGRIGTELDQLQGSMMTNYLNTRGYYFLCSGTIHHAMNKDEVEP